MATRDAAALAASSPPGDAIATGDAAATAAPPPDAITERLAAIAAALQSAAAAAAAAPHSAESGTSAMLRTPVSPAIPRLPVCGVGFGGHMPLIVHAVDVERRILHGWAWARCARPKRYADDDTVAAGESGPAAADASDADVPRVLPWQFDWLESLTDTDEWEQRFKKWGEWDRALVYRRDVYVTPSDGPDAVVYPLEACRLARVLADPDAMRVATLRRPDGVDASPGAVLAGHQPFALSRVKGDSTASYGDGGEALISFPAWVAPSLTRLVPRTRPGPIAKAAVAHVAGFDDDARRRLAALLRELSDTRRDVHHTEPVVDIIDPNLAPYKLIGDAGDWIVARIRSLAWEAFSRTTGPTDGARWTEAHRRECMRRVLDPGLRGEALADFLLAELVSAALFEKAGIVNDWQRECFHDIVRLLVNPPGKRALETLATEGATAHSYADGDGDSGVADGDSTTGAIAGTPESPYAMVSPDAAAQRGEWLRGRLLWRDWDELKALRDAIGDSAMDSLVYHSDGGLEGFISEACSGRFRAAADPDHDAGRGGDKALKPGTLMRAAVRWIPADVVLEWPEAASDDGDEAPRPRARFVDGPAGVVHNLQPRSAHSELYALMESLLSAMMPMLSEVGLVTRGDRVTRQVVVKAQEYALRPGMSYAGRWHMEGATENIVAAATYYAHIDEGLEGGNLKFRPQKVPEARHDYDTETEVEVRQDTCVVFANTLPHRFRRLRNPPPGGVAARSSGVGASTGAGAGAGEGAGAGAGDGTAAGTSVDPDKIYAQASAGVKRRVFLSFFFVDPLRRIEPDPADAEIEALKRVLRTAARSAGPADGGGADASVAGDGVAAARGMPSLPKGVIAEVDSCLRASGWASAAEAQAYRAKTREEIAKCVSGWGWVHYGNSGNVEFSRGDVGTMPYRMADAFGSDRMTHTESDE